MHLLIVMLDPFFNFITNVVDDPIKLIFFTRHLNNRYFLQEHESLKLTSTTFIEVKGKLLAKLKYTADV